jgi:hypothetical protein
MHEQSAPFVIPSLDAAALQARLRAIGTGDTAAQVRLT